MPDLKISQMITAANVSDADWLPLVQGLGNFKTNRADLLRALAGDAIRFVSPNSAVGIDGADNPTIEVGNAKSLIVNLQSGTAVQFFFAGGNTLQYDDFSFGFTVGTNFFSLSGGGLDVEVGSGQYFGVFGADGDNVWYDPTTSTLYVTAGSGHEIVISAAGGATLQTSGGATWAMISAAGIALNLNYQTPSASDWATLPANYEDAINRIATAVAGLLGFKIP